MFDINTVPKLAARAKAAGMPISETEGGNK